MNRVPEKEMQPILLEPPIHRQGGKAYLWLGLILGAGLGLFLAAPLPLIAQRIYGFICSQQPLRFDQILLQSFGPENWPALALFAFLGALVGALLGVTLKNLRENRQRLRLVSHEFELQVAALRHHYKNLTMGIHGFTTRIRRKLAHLDDEFRQCAQEDCPTYDKFHQDHEALKGHVGVLEEASERLNHILTQELQFLKALTSDSLSLEPQDFFPFLIHSIQDLLSLRFREKPIQVHMNGQPLEACRDSLVIRFEPYTMAVIFQNILSNAMKYGDRLEVEVGRRGDKIRVAITDNGPGVSMEKMKKELTTLTDRDQTSSTHLGLKVSLYLLMKIDGRLSFLSAPGQGATFIVEFPAQLI